MEPIGNFAIIEQCIELIEAMMFIANPLLIVFENFLQFICGDDSVVSQITEDDDDRVQATCLRLFHKVRAGSNCDDSTLPKWLSHTQRDDDVALKGFVIIVGNSPD